MDPTPMTPLRIVAHTPTGIARSDPWSPSLEGVLAYWWMKAHLDEEAFALGAAGYGAVLDADLPLGREHDGDTWWWQCSSPIVAPVGEHRRHFHRRFDVDAATRFTSVGRVEVKAGPLKNMRKEMIVTLTPTVTYHAIGHRAGVEQLLRRCTQLGALVGRGSGRVTRWVVTEDGEADLARFARPLPAAFAARHGREGLALDWGLRPPGRRHRSACVMPILEA